MTTTRGGGKAPRRTGAPRAAKAARVAPAPPASKPETDGLPLSDAECDALLEALAAVDVRSVAVALGVCRRWYRLGASNAPLWRSAIMESPYADLLPRLDAGWLLQSNPHLLAARLFSRRCAYCETPGEYWFTLQGRRVCRGCFEMDIQQPGAKRTEYPKTELSDFLSIAPATDDAAAGSVEAGGGAAATTEAVAAATGAGASVGEAGTETASPDGAAGGTPAAAVDAAASAPWRPPMCAYISKSLAKTLFCLGDKELNALRSMTLTGANVKRTGIGMGADAKITLVTSGDCLAAAVARYGSQAALVEEAASRRVKAQAAADAKRAEGKLPSSSSYLKSTINFPHLNQSRHSVFSLDSGLGLEYAVRSPFFQASGGRVLTVGVPDTPTAAGSDFVSFAAAVNAANAGDIIELLPGLHEAVSENVGDNPGGVYIHKAITIRGRPGADGERPCLMGARRTLVVLCSCFVSDLVFLSKQSFTLGDFGHMPTVLLCNIYPASTNRDVHVEFENCELRVPNDYNPESYGLMAIVHEGSPAGRTRVELKRCVSGRVSCEKATVELLTDAACVIDEVQFDDDTDE